MVGAVARSSASYRMEGSRWGEGGRKKKEAWRERKREKKKGVNTEILKEESIVVPYYSQSIFCTSVRIVSRIGVTRFTCVRFLTSMRISPFLF